MTFIEAVQALEEARKQGVTAFSQRTRTNFRTDREMSLQRAQVLVNGSTPTVDDVLSEDWR